MLVLSVALQLAAAQAQVDAVDSAFRARVASEGLPVAAAAQLADNAVLLYAGAPLTKGSPAVLTLLTRAGLERLQLTWTRTATWVAKAQDVVVTYSASGWKLRDSAATRTGALTMVWRKTGTSWKLEALNLGNIDLGAPPANPEKALDVPTPLLPRGPARAAIEADLAFSQLAQVTDAPTAFREFAAVDAVMLGPGGPYRGKDAIYKFLSGGDPAQWSWHPLVAGVAASGDLGYTVGYATINPRDTSQPTAYSKYLTIWMQTPDGVRFVTDGGNPRPPQ